MKLTLVKKVTEAKGTKTFFWKPEKPINYLPGQFYYFTLPKLNYPDSRGDTRHFTISSSPTERDIFTLTTRIREESGYKKTLDELAIGAIIEGEGPSGTFILDEQEKGNNVFIAGGIGITPFRSFIKYNIDKNLKIPMYLIYSNSDSDFAFKKELDLWSKENDFVKINYIDTSATGHITKLEKIDGTYWVVGPPLFVNAIEEILEKMNIPSGRIQSEKFTGY